MHLNSQHIRKLSGVLLLTLFVGYFGGINLFPHKHYVNGNLIVHSHPFSSEGHTHTAQSLYLLHSLSHFASKYLQLGIILTTLILFIHKLENCQLKYRRGNLFKYRFFLRPPPAYI
jgi:hypothetical protein